MLGLHADCGNDLIGRKAGGVRRAAVSFEPFRGLASVFGLGWASTWLDLKNGQEGWKEKKGEWEGKEDKRREEREASI
jgi:hypothetical protein